MTVSVLLIQPKHARNVGATLRSVSCYGGGSLFFTGNRLGLDGLRRLPREERMKAYADTPWTQLLGRDETRPVDRIQRLHGPLTPVCVELRPGSEPLTTFDHPDDALYVFGPEDDHVPDGLRRVCHRFVQIPSFHCLNLAAAAYTVLYDRMAKRVGAGLEEMPTIRGENRGGWWHDSALETDAFV